MTIEDTISVGINTVGVWCIMLILVLLGCVIVDSSVEKSIPYLLALPVLLTGVVMATIYVIGYIS